MPATSLFVFTVYPRPDAHGETFLQAKLEALNIFPSLAPFRHKWVKMEIGTRFQKLLGCWHEISRLDAKPNKCLRAQLRKWRRPRGKTFSLAARNIKLWKLTQEGGWAGDWFFIRKGYCASQMFFIWVNLYSSTVIGYQNCEMQISDC